MTEVQKLKLLKLMEEFWNKCDFAAIYKRVDLQFFEVPSVLVADEFVINSYNLIKFLGVATALFVAVVSAGSRISSLRDQFLADDDSYNAVIVDAVGSEFVASSLRLLKNIIEKKIVGQGQFLRGGWISPGVGDIPLEVQQDLFAFLNPERVGISLNEQLIMEPEKSSTAFFAVL